MRGKTRVNIGPAFPRWRTLRTRLGIRTDSDLALVLLDSFYKTRVPQELSVRPKKRSRDDLHNKTTDSKDTWETASEDSASDADCVASICLRFVRI
ncbi:putative zinc finger protein 260-like [Scophthalmus maximus]|uniref:Putative zinc finger protein 260-like n=1 Tax=Scophthalmus maximus TaxID=52904 RepID=A0A2U9CU24_SCOMX|nr:putative zinc finger protein 260-like [Scophthalmus maximus]